MVGLAALARSQAHQEGSSAVTQLVEPGTQPHLCLPRWARSWVLTPTALAGCRLSSSGRRAGPVDVGCGALRRGFWGNGSGGLRAPHGGPGVTPDDDPGSFFEPGWEEETLEAEAFEEPPGSLADHAGANSYRVPLIS